MKRWHKVQMSELRRIWKYLERKGICYNGCTHMELIRRHGERNIKHVLGQGWYVLKVTT